MAFGADFKRHRGRIMLWATAWLMATSALVLLVARSTDRAKVTA